jgi:hypothetical protein
MNSRDANAWGSSLPSLRACGVCQLVGVRCQIGLFNTGGRWGTRGCSGLRSGRQKSERVSFPFMTVKFGAARRAYHAGSDERREGDGLLRRGSAL